MSKISELSDGGALQSTDYLIAVRSGGNVKVQPNGTVTGTTGSFSGNVTFADNAKAIFGAGSDLQIYHDGSNSRIDDTGTGNLILRGSSAVSIQKYTGETLGVFNADGSVLLAHDNVTKFETTATGIDVTGTVTADGLTVDGDVSLTASGTERFSINREVSPDIQYKIATNNYHLALEAVGASQGDIKFATGTSSASDRMLIASNGDISFYEDTGTTPKFFWDASAESLGIGTTSPESRLTVLQSALDGNAILLPMAGSAVAESYSSIRGKFAVGNDFCQSEVRFGVENTGSGTGFLAFSTGTNSSTERMRITSSGNVGIGTSSPNQLLSINSTIAGERGISFDQSGSERIKLMYTNSSGAFVINNTTGGYTSFENNGSESARLDASGNLLVGTTSTSTGSIAGVVISATNSVFATRTSEAPLWLNRLSTDGDIVYFRKDGSTVGSIGTVSGDIYIGQGDTNVVFNEGGDQIIPAGASGANRDAAVTLGASGVRFKDLYLSGGVINSSGSIYIGRTDLNTSLWIGNSTINPGDGSGSSRDNAIDLGFSSARFDDIYATNALIQTSDRNEKQDIEELSEAERRVAVAAKGLLRKFRWISSVEEKGDDARIHFGIIAQDLQAAFEAEGLDAGRYAMFIHSTWTDEETGEERSRMGVRYSELLAFIIAAL